MMRRLLGEGLARVLRPVVGVRTLGVLAMAVVPAAWGAGGGDLPYSFEPSLNNQASLQRGAKLFMNYCSGCHSLQYLRYQRMARDLEIPEEVVEENLKLTRGEIHGHILSTMPEDKASEWFGKAPPDLSLTARSRGDDWIYSFLLSFYLDPETNTGVNNLVLENTAMPHVLAPLQGYRQLVAVEGESGHGGHPEFESVQSGQLNEAEYQAAVADLTNFLVYAGEPVKLVRYGLGVKVIVFLLLFTALAWLLKREYWRDVH